MYKTLTTHVNYLEGPESIQVFVAGEQRHGWCSLNATNSPDGFCGCREWSSRHTCRHLRIARAAFIATMVAWAHWQLSRAEQYGVQTHCCPDCGLGTCGEQRCDVCSPGYDEDVYTIPVAEYGAAKLREEARLEAFAGVDARLEDWPF